MKNGCTQKQKQKELVVWCLAALYIFMARDGMVHRLQRKTKVDVKVQW